MPRYIDAEAFIKEQCNSCDGACEALPCDCINCDSDCRCDMIQDLLSAPAISPDEVRGVVHCGECRYSEPNKVVGDKAELYCRLFIAGIMRNDFCSHGAKMEVSEDA